MKILNGEELVGFIKERQVNEVRNLDRTPKLLIIRDSENLVIKKYVELKKAYGEDIGVLVEDFCAKSSEEIREKVLEANEDESVNGIILQLPILEKEKTDELTDLIKPEKDVDGLGEKAKFDSATATAILWLLAGYDIKLDDKKIALVGRGKLVGRPLFKIFTTAGLKVEVFHRGSDLSKLRDFDVIISATGIPGLIKDEMIGSGAVLVDAGTASEKGVLKGDLDSLVRERKDLSAITPLKGGVGPLTVACLFDHVIHA